MKISVVIVCYQEEINIYECINSIMKQNFCDDFEILVIDNNSTDKTQEIVNNICNNNNNINLIINKNIGIAGSRNIGVRNAKYKYVAFTDADCVVSIDWLEKLVIGFEKYNNQDKKIIAVGGSNIPPKNKSNFYNALGIMLNSYIGSRGSVQGMVFNKDKEVEHLSCVNVLYDKNVIVEIGYFDEQLKNIGEDQDLTIRLRKKGYKFYYIKDTAVVHKLRSNLKLWGKNMFVYGFGRAVLFKKHPETFNFLFLIPIIFVSVLLFSIFIIFNIKFILIPLSVLCGIIFLATYLSIKSRRINLIPILSGLLFVTYFLYGLGELKGILWKK